MKKRRIIILSDLWGADKGDWLIHYTGKLEKYFDIVFYDSYQLAGFKAEGDLEETRHHHFVNGGIEKAVENVLQLEKKPIIVLAFSVGGTIAWKAALAGLSVNYLFAVSSTRLRYEENKPTTEIDLLYGEDDGFKPEPEWFEAMNISLNLFSAETHEMYRKKEVATVICSLIVSKTTPNGSLLT